jgi:ribonuclease PH
MPTQRSFDRSDSQLRPVTFERNYIKQAYGSCLVSFGNTRVLCVTSIDEGVPGWRKNSGKGWVSAEYALMPGSTNPRSRRETHGQGGRTQEIQRLIARSLRAVVDLNVLGEVTVTVDCDVIEADGGTRTAAISGAWLALNAALEAWKLAGRIKSNPVFDQLAAVSVGMVDGRILLDLDYHEDSRAEIDMNLVMRGNGEFVEVQGTGERATFDRGRLDKLLDSGEVGLRQLFEQQQALIDA